MKDAGVRLMPESPFLRSNGAKHEVQNMRVSLLSGFVK
jgi:hypothetical protein